MVGPLSVPIQISPSLSMANVFTLLLGKEPDPELVPIILYWSSLKSNMV